MENKIRKLCEKIDKLRVGEEFRVKDHCKEIACGECPFKRTFCGYITGESFEKYKTIARKWLEDNKPTEQRKFKVGDKVVLSSGEKWGRNTKYKTVLEILNCGYRLTATESIGESFFPWGDSGLELYIEKEGEKEMMWNRNNFDLEKFKNEDIAIHCDTLQKSEDLMKILDKEGITWGSGRFLIDEHTKDVQNTYLHNTCYELDRSLYYADVDYFKDKGYEIIEWEVVDEMKKDDKEQSKTYNLIEALKLPVGTRLKITYSDGSENTGYLEERGLEDEEGVVLILNSVDEMAYVTRFLTNATYTVMEEQNPISFFEAMQQDEKRFKIIHELYEFTGYRTVETHLQILSQDYTASEMKKIMLNAKCYLED